MLFGVNQTPNSQIAPQFRVWLTPKSVFFVWDPHQILTKTAIQKKLEIDAFLSAIAIAFQSAYRAEIHQNNIFFIF